MTVLTWCSRCHREGVQIYRHERRICVDCHSAETALWHYFHKPARKPHVVGSHPRSDAKLTWESVATIRSAYQEGARTCDLARQFRVDPSLISRVVKGLVWR